MRTPLDLDDDLLARAQAQFAPGTPKTVIFEEALRRLIQTTRTGQRDCPRRDPRLERLEAEGRVVLARATGTPGHVPGILPLDRLLEDLGQDREDR